MSKRFGFAVALGAILCLGAGLRMVAAAPAKDTAKDEPTVYRFDGTARGSVMGHACMMVILEPPMGGSTIQVAVPNKNPMGPYDPSPVVADVIKDLAKGALVKVHCNNFQGTPMVHQFSKYDAKPGEDTAHGFVFKSSAKNKVGKDDHVTIDVSKYGQDATIVIPNVKGSDGTPTPEPVMAALVDKLKMSTVIEVDAESVGGVVTAQNIDVYSAPVSGTFEKQTDIEVDGKKRPAAVVTVGGESQTLMLAGKLSADGRWTPDSRLVSAVGRLKAGAAVDAAIRDRAGQKVLREIRLTPAESK